MVLIKALELLAYESRRSIYLMHVPGQLQDGSNKLKCQATCPMGNCLQKLFSRPESGHDRGIAWHGLDRAIAPAFVGVAIKIADYK